MTQQTDWKAEREAIRARLEAAPSGPYSVKGWHKSLTDGGWYLCDAMDRLIATISFCEQEELEGKPINSGNDAARFFAGIWQDLRRLLERDEENERDAMLFDQLFAAWQDRLWAASGKIKGSPDLGMETIVQIIEKRLSDAALTSEFASHLAETLSTRAAREAEMLAERDQRISELEELCLDPRKAKELGDLTLELREYVPSVPLALVHRLEGAINCALQHTNFFAAVNYHDALRTVEAELAAARKANEESIEAARIEVRALFPDEQIILSIRDCGEETTTVRGTSLEYGIQIGMNGEEFDADNLSEVMQRVRKYARKVEK